MGAQKIHFSLKWALYWWNRRHPTRRYVLLQVLAFRNWLFLAAHDNFEQGYTMPHADFTNAAMYAQFDLIGHWLVNGAVLTRAGARRTSIGISVAANWCQAPDPLNFALAAILQVVKPEERELWTYARVRQLLYGADKRSLDDRVSHMVENMPEMVAPARKVVGRLVGRLEDKGEENAALLSVSEEIDQLAEEKASAKFADLVLGLNRISGPNRPALLKMSPGQARAKQWTMAARAVMGVFDAEG